MLRPSLCGGVAVWKNRVPHFKDEILIWRQLTANVTRSLPATGLTKVEKPFALNLYTPHEWLDTLTRQQRKHCALESGKAPQPPISEHFRRSSPRHHAVQPGFEAQVRLMTPEDAARRHWDQ